MFSSRKATKVLVASALVAAATYSAAFAANDVKATVNVNIRSQPTTSSSVKGILPKNATATKSGSSGNWIKVKYKDITGYVYESYLEDVKVSSNTSSTSSKTVYITASSLNIRSGPGTSYDVVGSLKKAASVNTYESTDGWYKIKYDGKTAYISAKYTSTKAPSDTSNSSSSPDSSNTATKKVYVTASLLNIRSGPGTRYSAVGSLKEGSAVATYGSTNGWYKIKHNGETAYISAKYTSEKAPSNDSSNSSDSSSNSSSSNSINYNVKITASALNVRSGAGTNFSIKETLYKDDVVHAIELSNGWYKIQLNGISGFISSKYAVKTSESVSFGGSSSAKSLSSAERSEIVSLARTKLGCPYVYGAEGPNRFDCSGFTQWLYQHFDMSLPRTSASQWNRCTKIGKSDLRPGDLVFFSTSYSDGDVAHVAMYIGNDTIIHAANPSSGVIVSSLSGNYYVKHYIGAGRY